MDKNKLYEDLVDLAGHVIALYFIMTDPHHLAQLAGRMDIHEWIDYVRVGKDGDQNLISGLLDDIQEVIAVPLLEDGYIGSKDMLAKALELTPDIEQNPKDIEKVAADARSFLDRAGNALKAFDDAWGDSIRKELGYKAKAYDNLLSTWCQYFAQYDGWLIGYKA